MGTRIMDGLQVEAEMGRFLVARKWRRGWWGARTRMLRDMGGDKMGGTRFSHQTLRMLDGFFRGEQLYAAAPYLLNYTEENCKEALSPVMAAFKFYFGSILMHLGEVCGQLMAWLAQHVWRVPCQPAEFWQAGDRAGDVARGLPF